MKKLTKKIFSFIVFQLFCFAIISPFMVFWGPFKAVKAYAVGSVYTSRHPQYLKLFLTEEEIKNVLSENERDYAAGSFTDKEVERSKAFSTDGITVEDIRGKGFKGKVMLIKDPTRVEVACTSSLLQSGERVSEMAEDSGAVAAINAGGFNDPNGKGNGGFPSGITMHAGKVIYDDSKGSRQELIGLDDKGKLVIENLSLEEAKARGLKEVISFFPQLVKDGRGLLKGDGGWGIAPRTGIGQRPDGTIIFVVIDGRQLQSIGATLRDLQNVFLEYGAYNAVNLDGGSSSTMVFDGKVINKPADIFGERYVPTAFVVKP